MRKILTVLAASTLASIASGGTIVVAPGQSIQSAIDAASAGDVIAVDPGFYHEGIDFKGKAIRLVGVGGSAVTTITAFGLGKDAVTFKTNEGPTSVLSGFTITGTTGIRNGIRCLQSNPRIEYCRIFGNGSINNPRGGGIDVYGSPVASNEPLVVSHCEISFNRASEGGGIACAAPKHVVIEDCAIFSNTGNSSGGGLHLLLSSTTPGATIHVARSSISGNLSKGPAGGAWAQTFGNTAITWTACTFADNKASHQGGGLVLNVSGSGSLPTVLRDCIFLRNEVPTFAGAVWAELYSQQSGIGHLRFANCSFVDNVAQASPGLKLTVHDDSRVEVWNSIVWNEASPQIVHEVEPTAVLEVSYSDVMGGFPGTANLDADPDFVDRVGGDLHLTALSRCRNNGDATLAQAASLTDFEGDPRVAEGTPDIGADEFYPRLYFTGTFAAGSTSNVRIIGTPGASPALFLSSLTLAAAPVPTPYGAFLLGLPLVPGFPISLGSVPALGVIDLPVLVPAGLPSGLAIHNQAFLGAPDLKLTAQATLTLP